MSFFKSIKQKLSKTSSAITGGVTNVFKKKINPAEQLEELQEVLIKADIGYEVSELLISSIKGKKYYSADEVINELKVQIGNILQLANKPLEVSKGKLSVIMMCGVNGNGKTTTTGKLAAHFNSIGMKVMLCACDTFRVAAVEQLEEWGNRTGCRVIKGETNSDPASLCYKALVEAKQTDVDVLIIDTAGRLHNKSNLMAELEKCVRVLKKIDPDAPHEVILTIDSTTGQNAHSQIASFSNSIPVTGLIFTKLDSSSKGGIVVGATHKYRIPIYAIGLGEKLEDLAMFEPKAFTDALLQ